MVEFGISKQQIFDMRKDKDKILKFTDNIETSEGFIMKQDTEACKWQAMIQALYSWFIQQRLTGTPKTEQYWPRLSHATSPYDGLHNAIFL